jgi:hypothetical protein
VAGDGVAGAGDGVAGGGAVGSVFKGFSGVHQGSRTRSSGSAMHENLPACSFAAEQSSGSARVLLFFVIRLPVAREEWGEGEYGSLALLPRGVYEGADRLETR